MKTSISDDSNYPNFCKQASEDVELFKVFRSHPVYTNILEHVTREQGQIYLDIIKKDYNYLLQNLSKYITNDNVGTPIKYHYEIGNISPTTIRYIKVLGDILKEFNDLSNLDIVEIGCGYGGQAKIICDTFNIKSYTLIDLPPVLDLTKRYLSSFNINQNIFKFVPMDDLNPEQKYDLFISNYAYTECSRNVQNVYYDYVIKNCSMGYMTCNFISDIFKINSLSLNELLSMIKNSSTIEEYPKTHQNNIILKWKN